MGYKLERDGLILKRLLAERSISQKAFAQLMEISEPTLSNMLNDETKPEFSKAQLSLICNLLEVDVEVFNRPPDFFSIPFSKKNRASFEAGNSEFIGVDNTIQGEARYFDFFTQYFDAFDQFVIKKCQESLYVLDYLPGKQGLDQREAINSDYHKKNSLYYDQLEKKLSDFLRQGKAFVYKRAEQLPYYGLYGKNELYEDLNQVIKWADGLMVSLNPEFAKKFSQYLKDFSVKSIPYYTGKFENESISALINEEYETICKSHLPIFPDAFTKAIAIMTELLEEESYQHILKCYFLFPEYFSLYVVPAPARLYKIGIIDKKVALTEYPRFNISGMPIANQLFVDVVKKKQDASDRLIKMNLQEFKILTRRVSPTKGERKRRVLQEDFLVANNLAFNYLKRGIVELMIRYEFLRNERQLISDPQSPFLKKLREVKALIEQRRNEFVFRAEVLRKRYLFTIQYLSRVVSENTVT